MDAILAREEFLSMQRDITPAILKSLPRKIVLLSGPRQVGKTTLARSLSSKSFSPMRMRAARTAFLVLLLASGLQIFHHYPRLPERVASHFDGAGEANGFQSRSVFLAFHAGGILLVAAIFLLLPALLHRIPPRLINLPRRDYWLAPERRESSIALLATLLTWFGVATLALLTVVMELVIRANLPGGGGRLSPVLMWALLGAYFLFVAAWLAVVFTRFLRVPR